MRISVRWWLTAGCDWPCSLHKSVTCIGPRFASAMTIVRRDLSASSLNTAVMSLSRPSGTPTADERCLPVPLRSDLRDFLLMIILVVAKVWTPALALRRPHAENEPCDAQQQASSNPEGVPLQDKNTEEWTRAGPPR